MELEFLIAFFVSAVISGSLTYYLKKRQMTRRDFTKDRALKGKDTEITIG